MIRRSFVISAAATALLPSASRAADTVSGRYVGNGKDVTLAFVSAWVRDGMSGKPAVMIVMTEKDHAASKKPDFDASFGKFGSALIISLHRDDGGVFSCQVAHQALKRPGVSVLTTGGRSRPVKSRWGAPAWPGSKPMYTPENRVLNPDTSPAMTRALTIQKRALSVR